MSGGPDDDRSATRNSRGAVSLRRISVAEVDRDIAVGNRILD
jgi:hypothetical protein